MQNNEIKKNQPRKGGQIQEPSNTGSVKLFKSFASDRHKSLTWHRQSTVKVRAAALQESFYPTTDVSYNAVKQRMADLLGIVDRASILAYLGRPQTKKEQKITQIVRYQARGSIVNKDHTFRQILTAKKGYIETFGLGHCYSVDGEWFIHWNHMVQTVLPLTGEQLDSEKQSIENISLTKIRTEYNGCTESPKKGDIEKEREERENLNEREILKVKVFPELKILEAKPCEAPNKAFIQWPTGSPKIPPIAPEFYAEGKKRRGEAP